MRKKYDLTEADSNNQLQEYTFHQQDRKGTGRKDSSQKDQKWKVIAIIFIALFLFNMSNKYFGSSDKPVAPAPKEETKLETPTKENFLTCYSTFQAIAVGKKLTDAEKVYASQLAQVQYAMVMEQLNDLPSPTKKNVEEVRRKVYNINWMLIAHYDNICVYYSDGPLTKRYFQSKLAYVREIADVYHSMGYSEERIYNLLGDSPGNYYGIKN